MTADQHHVIKKPGNQTCHVVHEVSNTNVMTTHCANDMINPYKYNYAELIYRASDIMLIASSITDSSNHIYFIGISIKPRGQ